MSFEDLKLEALKLDFDDREDLVHALHQSLDEEDPEPEVERAILDEVKRRYQDIVAGRTELLSGEDVFAELRAELD